MKRILPAVAVFLVLYMPVARGLDGARVALYNDYGVGVWQDGRAALKAMLSAVGLTWEEIDYNQLNDPGIDLASLYDIIVFPGGSAVSYNANVSAVGKGRLRAFVSAGGGYLGFGGGALFASDSIVWAGESWDDPYYTLDLYDGVATGPIDDIAQYLPNYQYAMTSLTYPAGAVLADYDASSDSVLYYGGPWFSTGASRPGVEAVATYDDYSQGAAIIAVEYGTGRVVLSGVHPEIQEDLTTDQTTFADELGDSGSDWEMVLHLLNWLLKADSDADRDGDGLSDTWEVRWFGSVQRYNGGDDPDDDESGNSAELAAGTDPTTCNVQGADVGIYRGGIPDADANTTFTENVGVWGDGLIAIGNMLTALGLTYEEFNHTDVNNPDVDLTSLYKVLIFPGGTAYWHNYWITNAGKARIRAFLDNGGGYLGICAGSFFASDRVFWSNGDYPSGREFDDRIEDTGDGVPAVTYYYNHLRWRSFTSDVWEDEYSGYSLDVFPGLASGPLTDIAVFDDGYTGATAQTYDFAMASLTYEAGASALADYDATSGSILYFGGPWFSVDSRPGLEVIARYDYNQEPAIVSMAYGSGQDPGRVVLSAVHPETEEGSLGGTGDADGVSIVSTTAGTDEEDLDDAGSDWEMTLHLLNWLLKAGADADRDDAAGDPGGTGDGVPDTWEVRWFGTVKAYSGAGDPDGDGISNRDECALGTDPTSADVPVTADDFDDGVKGDMWYLIEEDPQAVWLDETNQRLEVRCVDAPGDLDADCYSRGWRLSTAQDFAVQVDWHHSAVLPNGECGAYLMVANPEDMDSEVDVDVYNCYGETGYETESNNIDGQDDYHYHGPRAVDNGKFYVSYDSGNDRLHLSVNGYWQPEDANSGDWVLDGVVHGSWAADSVVIRLGAWAFSATVASGEVYFDNFEVRQGTLVVPPTHRLTVEYILRSGVAMDVRPEDNADAANGTTPFTRTYDEGIPVYVTAPGTDGNGGVFDGWSLDDGGGSVALTSEREALVWMKADCTLTPLYGTGVAVSVLIEETGDSTDVAEGGATDTYDVSLATAPTGTVTVTLDSGDQLTVNPSTLNFTSTTAQTVTVTAVDDSYVEGTHTGTITHTVSATGTNFEGVTAPDVVVNIEDDDAAGFSLSETAVTVAENGGQQTFAVTLDAPPLSGRGTVKFNVSSDDTAEAMVSPATLTFTGSTWDTPQTVTVTGVPDSTVSADTALVSVSVDVANTHAAFQGMSAQTVDVTCTDDDGSLTVTIQPAAALADGVQWSIDGTTWHNSGDQFILLGGANYTVEFSNLSGWITPADDTVAVPAGGSVSRTWTYAAIGSAVATHQLVGGGYASPGTCQVSGTLEYPGDQDLTAATWTFTLPSGLTLSSVTGDAGATDITGSSIVFPAGRGLASSPLGFTATFTVPDAETGDKTISSAVDFTLSVAGAQHLVVSPDVSASLVPTSHPADTGGDGKIGMIEYLTYAGPVAAVWQQGINGGEYEWDGTTLTPKTSRSSDNGILRDSTVSVTRGLSEDMYVESTEITVTLTVTVDSGGNVALLAIEEQLPTGWVASEVTGGGVYNSSDNRLTWTINAPTTTSLTYRITAPASNLADEYTLTGTSAYSTGGPPISVNPGNSVLTKRVAHPADTDGNFRIGMIEYLTYAGPVAAVWQQGINGGEYEWDGTTLTPKTR